MPKKTIRKTRVRKTDIVPLTKVPEGKLIESSSLEDYEKVAAKIALSQDEIIDRAIDAIEGRQAPQPPPQPAQQPTSAPKPTKPAENPQPEKQAEKSIEEIVKTQEIAHQAEISALKAELDSVRSELGKYQRGELKDKFRSEIDELTNCNDNLILRNSELEFEISRLGAENTRLKQQLETLSNKQRLPPQTYSKEAYTRFNNSRPSQPGDARNRERERQLQQQQMLINQLITPPHIGMNGYESWN